MGTLRDCLLVNSGMVTWIVLGTISTPVTVAPEASTGVPSTSRSKSRPPGSSATLTTTATTFFTAVEGPSTWTCCGT